MTAMPRTRAPMLLLPLPSPQATTTMLKTAWQPLRAPQVPNDSGQQFGFFFIITVISQQGDQNWRLTETWKHKLHLNSILKLLLAWRQQKKKKKKKISIYISTWDYFGMWQCGCSIYCLSDPRCILSHLVSYLQIICFWFCSLYDTQEGEKIQMTWIQCFRLYCT